MTREEAIEMLKKDKEQRGNCFISDALDMAIKALEQERSRSAEITQYRHDCEKLMEENEWLKKALEQQPILDKIRDEIEHKALSGQWSDATRYGLLKAVAIIDKYKAESEIRNEMVLL